MMPVKPAASKWLVDYDDGSFNVTRNTRAFAYGLASVDVAIAAIKRSRKYQAGDKITAYDEFGNRVLVR
jgi:predicted Ser/Thr protein kinase